MALRRFASVAARAACVSAGPAALGPARLGAAAAAGLARGFASGAESQAAFLEAFAKVAPSTMDPPLLPDAAQPVAPDKAPEKLTLNLYLPHETLHGKEEVDMVLVPASTGDFGVLPGHVPVVAQLKPGVLSVHKELDKDVKKYFVSSGFAFVHPDSTADICAVEAVPLDDLDGEAIKAGLADYQAKLVNAKDDYEKATAQIGVEVCQAMGAAIGAA